MLNSVKKYLNDYRVKAALLVLVVFIAAIGIRNASQTTSEAVAEELPLVTLTSAAQVAGTQNISLIGNVRAFTEAKITSERAGRVTSVSTSLGNTVAAGQVIASLENASEQATVLQAQGAYEAALAAASQSNLSTGEALTAVTGAENGLVTSIRNSYTTANQIVRNDIDTFFANPDSFIPGVRLDARGQSQFLNNERIAFQNILQNWSSRSTLVSPQNAQEEAAYAKTQLNRTLSFVNTFLELFPQQNAGDRYTEAQINSFISTFTADRSALITAIATIENAENNLERAEEAAQKAASAGAGGSASTADAQVKQALGSLRAAQASLAKTLLRTPIGGTVNELKVKTGDFIGSFEQIALVANNNALEIVTYVGDLEKERLVVGDVVEIEGEYEGIITVIAPAVDSITKKTEVRIATENQNISNGDTVRITKTTEVATTATPTIRIPLSAVKLEAANGSVLQVEDGVLTQKPVVLGAVRGNFVEITEGLSASEQFVSDARGLTVGTKVEISE